MTRNCSALSLAVALLAGWQAVPAQAADSAAPADPGHQADFAPNSGNAKEFVYRARKKDTIIGISNEMLREPDLWPEVQALNHVKEPRHLQPGETIRIPYQWLKVGEDTAKVARTNGVVVSGNQPVVEGQQLKAGSVLHTNADGSVTLQLADGSLVQIPGGSTVHLDAMHHVVAVPEAHDTRVRLEKGRVEVKASPQGQYGRFEVSTPLATSAVRGTVYRVGYRPEENFAAEETLEGAVQVANSTGAQRVPADFGTVIPPSGAPLAPIKLLDAPDLAGVGDKFVDPTIDLHWGAVSQAASYRMQVAADSGFQSLVADQLVTTPAAHLDSLADGHYWVRVRAIDSHGLEGKNTDHPFERVKAPPVAHRAVPDVDMIDGGQMHIHWEGLAEARYRVQVAKDANFNRVVIDQVVTGVSANLRRPFAGSYYARVLPAEAPTADAAADDGRPAVRAFSVPLSPWAKSGGTQPVQTPQP